MKKYLHKSHVYYIKLIEQINYINFWLPSFIIRLLLAYEFAESGYEKWHGSNWFAELAFPFPFNLLPASVSWNLAVFFELAGAIALVLGLFTRFFSVSLIILTVVAIAAVHWPEHWSTVTELLKGYRIIDENNDGFGNYKLPLIYIVMFLPLLFGGAGKFSVDHLIERKRVFG